VRVSFPRFAVAHHAGDQRDARRHRAPSDVAERPIADSRLQGA
jgi:hypothetical protein